MKSQSWTKNTGLQNRPFGKRKILGSWGRVAAMLLLVGLLTAMLGCTIIVRRRPGPVGSVIYVQKAPPSPRAETRPAKPNPRAVWVPGHWRWNSHKYAWKRGHWEKKPRGAVWVPGRWQKKPRGWVWVQGHWR